MKNLLLLFAFIISYAAQAQNFNQLYHAKGMVRANAVVCNPNGEYINAGDQSINFDTHEYVAKVNPNGDTAWVRPFNIAVGQRYGDDPYCITRLKNGNYIIGSGSGDSMHKESAADLTWVTDNGVILKTTKYVSDTNSQDTYSVKERANGNLVLSGLRYKRGDTLTNTVGDADILMVGTDSNGSQLWENVFGTSNDDVMNSMDTTVGKGYILGGYSGNYMCMAKTDSLGKKIWLKTYPNFMGSNNLNSGASTVLTAKDGGYFLSGSLVYTDGTTNGYIIKTDSGGVIQWQKQYRGVSIESYFDGMKQLPNGDLLVSGSQEQDPNLNRYFGWLVKLDVNGNLLWQHTYNYYTQDSTGHYIYSMDVTPDKGVIMAGMVIDFRPHHAYSNQVWLVKTDSLGNVVTNGIQQNGKLIPFATLALSPNPSTTNSILSYQLAAPTAANLTISDINGKVLKTYTLPTTDKGQITLDATQYPQGVYFCKLLVQNQPQQVVKWVVAK